jgi:pyruvate kinase
MLAGETAVGAYPVRAVQTLDAVIRDAELLPLTDRIVPATEATHSRHGRALCEAAVTLAATAQADAIVAVTRTGQTARLLSALRPATPVVAATASRDVVGACKMLWGVAPLLTPAREVAELAELLLSQDPARSGAVVVVVNVSAELSRTDANFINVQRLGLAS